MDYALLTILSLLYHCVLYELHKYSNAIIFLDEMFQWKFELWIIMQKWYKTIIEQKVYVNICYYWIVYAIYC